MKSVYKTFVAWFVSFSVIASALAGAFAVSWKKAFATPSTTIYTWSQLEDIVTDIYPNHEDIESWFAYFANSDSINYPIGIDIFNDNQYLVLAALGSEPGEIAITVWKWISNPLNYYHDDGWQINNDIISATPSSGYILSREGFFYSDISEYHLDRTSRSYNLYPPVSNQAFSFGAAWQVYNNHLTVFPNTMTFYNANYRVITSRPIYTPNSSVLDYEATLVGAPISEYNNVCFTIGNQYYFTFSDQSILQSFIQGSGSAYVPVTFQKNGNFTTYNFYFDELYYTGRSSVNGVTNVGPGGVLAWNITPIVNQYYFDSVGTSHVEPAEVYRNYFANNEAIISWNPYTDPAAQYEYYLEQFQNALQLTPAVIPDQIPGYVSQQTTSNYPGNVKIYSAGSLGGFVYLNQLPDVSFDQVLVIDEKAFDILNITLLGTLEIDEDVFRLNYLTELMQQSDLICVVGHSDFNEIIDNCYSTHPDHFLYFTDSQWSIGGQIYFTHGLWYMTSTTDEVEPLAKKDCVSIVTNRYLQHVNNWILADGVDFLYRALNGISDNQTNFFTGALNSLGGVLAGIETINGNLTNLYNFLKFDVKLSTQLESIVDKLQKIVDNTDIEGEENSFWIAPLYNFLKLFEPSESDYTSSISEIVSTLDELPDIPSVTPVAIPTSQIFLPGE